MKINDEATWQKVKDRGILPEEADFLNAALKDWRDREADPEEQKKDNVVEFALETCTVITIDKNAVEITENEDEIYIRIDASANKTATCNFFKNEPEHAMEILETGRDICEIETPEKEIKVSFMEFLDRIGTENYALPFLRNENERAAAALYLGGISPYHHEKFKNHPTLLRALTALEKQDKTEPLRSYWERVRSNPVARRVMLADLTLRQTEIAEMEQDTKHRQKRVARLKTGVTVAIEFLSGGEYSERIEMANEECFEFYPEHHEDETGYTIYLPELNLTATGATREQATVAMVEMARKYAEEKGRQILKAEKPLRHENLGQLRYILRIKERDGERKDVRGILRLDKEEWG